MMPPEEAKQLLESDPDFIYSKRFNNSLHELVERYPEGAPDRIIAGALMIPEYEVEELYQQAIVKLRMIMGVTE